MGKHSSRVNPRSFHKGQVRQFAPSQSDGRKHAPRKRGHDDHHFVVNAMGALSNAQKGLLVVSALLLVGAAAAAVAGGMVPPVRIPNADGHQLSTTTALGAWQGPVCLPQVRGIQRVQHAFFSQPPLPKACIGQEEGKPTLFYKGIVVKDVSKDISGCKKKAHGLSAGKICDIGGVRHYLKVVETEDTHAGRKTNSLLGIYNLALISNNFGVAVPEVFIAFEENGLYSADEGVVAPAVFYVASKEVGNFTTGGELIKKIHRDFLIHQAKHPFSTQSFAVEKRKHIVSKIGEEGLAKLAVAGTFFQDLINNDGNWGFNEDGLVIIDVDNSPGDFNEYLAEAARVPRNIEVDFSVDNVKMMRKNYLSMLHKALPVIHRSVDMGGMFYQTLVKVYLSACDKALLKIEEEYPGLPADLPVSNVNDILSESLIDAMACARENGLFSAYQRYRSDATHRELAAFSM